VRVLFVGADGAAKLMAAQKIADEAGLGLYRVELSAVVSKYIGETEKNLDRIFAAAERENSLLFFDEADALFGKRTDVKDSHDRYANLEVNYLLQRMEEFDGAAVIALNRKGPLRKVWSRDFLKVVRYPPRRG
jgi:SpoVK/Ycf46/Vps4 family AAA+-type ATPase